MADEQEQQPRRDELLHVLDKELRELHPLTIGSLCQGPETSGDGGGLTS